MLNRALKEYSAFYEFTEYLITIAKNANWDEVIELQPKYATMSAQLTKLDDLVIKDDAVRDELISLSERILHNIYELNQYFTYYKERLMNDMSGLNSQKKVHLTYSEFSDQAIEQRMLKDIFRQQ